MLVFSMFQREYEQLKKQPRLMAQIVFKSSLTCHYALFDKQVQDVHRSWEVLRLISQPGLHLSLSLQLVLSGIIPCLMTLLTRVTLLPTPGISKRSTRFPCWQRARFLLYFVCFFVSRQTRTHRRFH